MHKRLMGFLNDQKKVLYKKQFGFQKKNFLLNMQSLALLKILKRQ